MRPLRLFLFLCDFLGCDIDQPQLSLCCLTQYFYDSASELIFLHGLSSLSNNCSYLYYKSNCPINRHKKGSQSAALAFPPHFLFSYRITSLSIFHFLEKLVNLLNCVFVRHVQRFQNEFDHFLPCQFLQISSFFNLFIEILQKALYICIKPFLQFDKPLCKWRAVAFLKLFLADC